MGKWRGAEQSKSKRLNRNENIWGGARWSWKVITGPRDLAQKQLGPSPCFDTTQLRPPFPLSCSWLPLTTQLAFRSRWPGTPSHRYNTLWGTADAHRRECGGHLPPEQLLAGSINQGWQTAPRAGRGKQAPLVARAKGLPSPGSASSLTRGQQGNLACGLCP